MAEEKGSNDATCEWPVGGKVGGRMSPVLGGIEEGGGSSAPDSLCSDT